MFGQLTELYNEFRAFRAAATNARLARLDNLDVLLSSRLSEADAQQALAALTAIVQTRATPQKMVVLDTPGAGNFVVPSGVFSLNVSLCGAGGGCILFQGNSSHVAVANGGCGASIIDVDVQVVPGQVIPYLIGAGGDSLRRTTNSSGYVYAQNGGDTSFLDFVCKGGVAARGAYSTGSAPIVNFGHGGKFYVVANDDSNGSVTAVNLLIPDNVHYFNGDDGASANNASTLNVATTPLFSFDRAGMCGFATFASSWSIYRMDHGRNGIIVIKMNTSIA